LRELTGKDVGPKTEAWVKLYPHADAESEGLRISQALLKAAPDQRDALLAKYRDAKDDGYTEGLANAVPYFKGKLQGKGREALVVRLTRLPADSLRAKVQDEDAEIRHAAAIACTRKADEELVPELIELLLHTEAEITDGALKNLQRLTGQDFGPGV